MLIPSPLMIAPKVGTEEKVAVSPRSAQVQRTPVVADQESEGDRADVPHAQGAVPRSLPLGPGVEGGSQCPVTPRRREEALGKGIVPEAVLVGCAGQRLLLTDPLNPVQIEGVVVIPVAIAYLHQKIHYHILRLSSLCLRAGLATDVAVEEEESVVIVELLETK